MQSYLSQARDLVIGGLPADAPKLMTDGWLERWSPLPTYIESLRYETIQVKNLFQVVVDFANTRQHWGISCSSSFGSISPLTYLLTNLFFTIGLFKHAFDFLFRRYVVATTLAERAFVLSSLFHLWPYYEGNIGGSNQGFIRPKIKEVGTLLESSGSPSDKFWALYLSRLRSLYEEAEKLPRFDQYGFLRSAPDQAHLLFLLSRSEPWKEGDLDTEAQRVESMASTATEVSQCLVVFIEESYRLIKDSSLGLAVLLHEAGEQGETITSIQVHDTHRVVKAIEIYLLVRWMEWIGHGLTMSRMFDQKSSAYYICHPLRSLNAAVRIAAECIEWSIGHSLNSAFDIPSKYELQTPRQRCQHVISNLSSKATKIPQAMDHRMKEYGNLILRSTVIDWRLFDSSGTKEIKHPVLSCDFVMRAFQLAASADIATWSNKRSIGTELHWDKIEERYGHHQLRSSSSSNPRLSLFGRLRLPSYQSPVRDDVGIDESKKVVESAPDRSPGVPSSSDEKGKNEFEAADRKLAPSPPPPYSVEDPGSKD